MEFTKTISVLFFVDTMDNTKEAIIAVEDFEGIIFSEIFKRLQSEIEAIIGCDTDDDDGFDDLFDVIDKVASRRSAKYKEYEFFWENVNVF